MIKIKQSLNDSIENESDNIFDFERKNFNSNYYREMSVVVNKAKRILNIDLPVDGVAGVLKEKIERSEWVESCYFENEGTNQMMLCVRLKGSKLIRNVLDDVFDNPDYGFNGSLKGKNVCVEYSSPNIAKPFHAGHLRSTIIGQFLCNIYRAEGANVTAINYLGDWGKQFGLLVYGYRKYGSEIELKKDPIQHLYDVYVKINEDATTDETIHDNARSIFSSIENDVPEDVAIWKLFRSISIEEYKKIYKRLNITFDDFSGESGTIETLPIVRKILEDKNLINTDQDDGAERLNLRQYGLGETILTKKDGSTLYITRDIAAAYARNEKYQFDKLLYVVANAQDLHFKQLFKTLELCGFDWHDKCEHINFGLVQGMSTRKGTSVFLSTILDQSESYMRESIDTSREYDDIDDTIRVLANSAVVIQDLKSYRGKGYKFEWDRMTSSHGFTGPYLQYAHCRLVSLRSVNNLVSIHKNVNTDLLVEAEAANIAFQVAKYPSIITETIAKNEPSVLVSYLFDLCHGIACAHSVLWVKDQQKELAESRMALFFASEIVLKSALKIIGLKPLDKM